MSGGDRGDIKGPVGPSVTRDNRESGAHKEYPLWGSMEESSLKPCHGQPRAVFFHSVIAPVDRSKTF